MSKRKERYGGGKTEEEWRDGDERNNKKEWEEMRRPGRGKGGNDTLAVPKTCHQLICRRDYGRRGTLPRIMRASFPV